MFFSPRLDAYVVTRHKDIETVLKRPASFSARVAKRMFTPLCPAAQAALEAAGFEPTNDLTVADEPLHMQMRKLLSEPFDREHVEAFEPVVRAVATRYIDGFIGRGRADLVQELAWTGTADAAITFGGIPETEAARAKDFSSSLFRFIYGQQSEDEQVRDAETIGRYQAHSRAVLEKVLEDPSGTGTLPFAVRKHLDVGFDRDFLLGTVVQTVTAAHETTSNAMGSAFRLLLAHRDAWDAICADASLIPNAVEEILRYAPVFSVWRRLCLEDTELSGVTIPAGALVVLAIASGNYDESVFADPERFDIRRANARRHLTFGFGSHHCLGVYLARAQLRIYIEELAHRLPHMQLVEGQAYPYAHIAAVGGPLSVEVEWDPAGNPRHPIETVGA